MIKSLYYLNDRRKGIHRLGDLKAVFNYLEQAEQAFQVSHAQGMNILNKIRYIDTNSNLNLDPFSESYKKYQMDLYLKISGKSVYNCKDAESSKINEIEALHNPYPYSTKNPVDVGNYFISMGFVLRALSCPPGSSIVEFGPGWGHTTIALAKMGYKVTVVEIDAAMCSRLRRLAIEQQLDITIIHDDMLSSTKNFLDSGVSFDCAMFFESFHHCEDHITLISHLKNLLLKNGSILFGAEPITYFPTPWGLRLDGLSLWSIKRYGWFELGFDKKYFRSLMLKNGFSLTFDSNKVTHGARFLIAHKNS